MNCCENNNQVTNCEVAQVNQAVITKPVRKILVKPNMQFGETKNSYVIYAELPGVNQEQVELSLEKNVLSLSATQHFQADEKFKHVLGVGAPVTYQRNVLLPEDFDREGLKAVIKDGLLKIELPKKAEAVAAKIQVQAG